MKIDILSDLHIDFWLNPTRNKVVGRLERMLNNLLDPNPEVEVLISAGDLGHYNTQALNVLHDIAEKYNYKKIFCVLGNHDLYLVSNAQKKKYHNNSGEREEDWYSYKDPKGIIEILNGDVTEFKGIKFGGAMSWYDGSYLMEPNMYGSSVIQEWKNTMNDAHLIYKKGDFYDLSFQELPKIRNILDVDVIITHICPLAERIAFQERYQYEKSSKFYAFDGEKYLKETNAKYWIYGHSHGHHQFEVYDTKVIMNALGYPGEFAGTKKTQIEI